MLLFAGCLSAQDNLSALLPMPNQVKQIESKKDFIISGKTTIQTNLPEDAFCIAELKDILRQRTGKTPTLSSTGSGSSVIRLILDPSVRGDGHYLLSVSEKTVSKRATFHSVRTYDLRSDSVRRCNFIGKIAQSKSTINPVSYFIDVRSGTSFSCLPKM